MLEYRLFSKWWRIGYLGKREPERLKLWNYKNGVPFDMPAHWTIAVAFKK
jgi:hypothetical protein